MKPNESHTVNLNRAELLVIKYLSQYWQSGEGFNPRHPLTRDVSALMSKLESYLDGAGLGIDTSPEAERLQFDLLRKAEPWQKMAMLSGMETSVRELMSIRLSEEYPEATEGELRYLLADLLYGKEMGVRIRRMAEEQGEK